MMVLLKLPLVYLCAVVYWAVKAEPEPFAGAALVPTAPEPEPVAPCTWRERRQRRPGPRTLRPSPRGARARA
jgi:hypothetical protein